MRKLQQEKKKEKEKEKKRRICGLKAAELI